jgi:hypothetical protein
MFQRGRLDHFALHVTSEEAFRELQRRVLAELHGEQDGVIADMGSLLLFSFTDPDAGRHEVVWPKPGMPLTNLVKRADWNVEND